MLTVELFEHRGVLVANEIAPRVHNSGHWTIEGAATSQFEQHLRAVLGLALGIDRDARSQRNGQLHRRAPRLPPPCSRSRARTSTTYGKTPRTGRKVGHVTVVADEPEARDQRLAQVRALQHDDG